tara:strand:- start:34 stop:153 length:120 start_codon:yes stop_codon:yes gene_type:complete
MNKKDKFTELYAKGYNDKSIAKELLTFCKNAPDLLIKTP